MKFYNSFLLVLISICIFSTVNRSSAQTDIQYVVIVNKDNPVESLTKSDLMKLMLRNVMNWDLEEFDHPIEAADLMPDSPVRNRFSHDVMGNSVSAIKQIWSRQLRAGNVKPPKEFESESEVMEFVGSRPGGIGYVSAKTELIDSVKAIQLK